MVALVIAMAAAALCAVWVLPERPSTLLRRRLRQRSAAVPRALIWFVMSGAGILGVVTLADRPHLMLVGAVAVGVALAAAHLVRRGRERAARVVRRSHTIDLCDALVAELRAGQPPSTALCLAAAEWPELEVLGPAATRGADVPRLLRSLAERPGAEPLLQLAAGWEVAHRSGARLADVLERLSVTLRSDEDVRLEIAGALGPPRATARLLAVLPVFGALLGTGLGGDPVGVLVGSFFGAVCLAAGAGLAICGLFWVERIAAGAEA